MFDLGVALDPPRLRGWTSALADTDLVDDVAAQVDEIRALEKLGSPAGGGGDAPSDTT